jgi:predicted protein tyrosine phosphatase
MKRILCVCALGRNRSKYLAEYLAKKGYETRYMGVDCTHCRESSRCNLLHQEDVDWADVIIIVRKRLKKNFKEVYEWEGKRVIVLDVTDSRKVAARKNPKFALMDNKKFQHNHVRPQLRKAIKPYLPL